ncbi:ATP-binding protein [Kribbella sp. NPDC058245]|uniref:AAA family ATPase n=1 Tax=Kribbella sp. NPDC058245 TaxID=3346399 RepID=UPI0036EEABBE
MESPSYRQHVERFIDSAADRHTLGLVYGRRRIGKSTLLEAVTRERGGFYWEATRTETAIQLSRLGEALGEHLGVGRVALDSWDEAFRQLLRLGEMRQLPVVVDEFGHVLAADPSADSIVATAIGPAARRSSQGQARLVLCGSAMAMMGSLTAGEAPLRGRAGMELVMQPADFRDAANWLGAPADLGLAARVYAVIGGVVGYATDMVDHDLPSGPGDFDRWIVERLLSPAATLHHEATTLLAEDPTLAAANPVILNSILGAIANGSVAAGKIANQLRRSVSNIEPAVRRLIAAGFVVRHADPVRSQRPTYALADPFLQFHYAVLEPHSSLLRDREPFGSWERRLAPTFDAHVRGPVFEEQVRSWVRRFASAETLGAEPDYVGPSAVVIDGTERQLDVVVAEAKDPDEPPGSRTICAIGEAKSGETIGHGHLRVLEQARAAYGSRATQAKLLLAAPTFTAELREEAVRRHDIELIDLERLYHGS